MNPDVVIPSSIKPIVHHADTSIQDFENFADLHSARAVAIVENCVADDDAAFGINGADTNFRCRPPRFRSEIAFVTADVAAILNAIASVLSNPTTTS